MKIIFCIDSLKKAGAERVVTNLANDYCKNNDVLIITTKYTESDYKINENIKILSLDNNRDKVRLKNIQRLYYLKKYIKEFNPDVIVAFLPRQSFRVLALKPLIKKKVIISVRNDPNQEYKSFKNKIAMKILYPKANGFVFQTEDAKNYFNEKIKKKSVIIPNPVNENFLVKPYSGKREKTIVNVGRLEEQKNQKLLIEAFYELQKKHKDYILKIYGEGSLENELHNQINQLNLNNKVFLMGKVDDIKEQIYKANIFVLTSNYEGMPNALMEAMALGIPCISTDCPIGGPKYLIQHKENGLLFQPNNKEELVQHLNLLIEDNDLCKKISENANIKAQEFKATKINKLWMNYIEKVLSNK